jgi:methyltransferase (TIGR00027 family)
MSFVDPISATARLTAAARARETRRPDRLFEDPWAAALAGREGVALMTEMEEAASPPGGADTKDNPYIAIRTRFFDDFLLEAVGGGAGGGVAGATRDDAPALRQVVILAAGLDARAFRLDWPSGLCCYEIDRADVLHAKDELLRAAGALPRCARHVIAADLTGPWPGALAAGGFDAATPSVWLIEGLTPYLDETTVRALLAQCASMAAPGSRLGIDVLGQSFFRSPWTRSYLQALERAGAPWKFGTDDPEGLLGAAGWNATVVRPGEPGASFGRWRFPVAPRGVADVPTIFIATATRR